MAESENSLLELEHVIGYTGKQNVGPVCLPNRELGFVVGLGSNVTICDVADSHMQQFLQGHDADITALDVSYAGRFIASGQAKSPLAPAGDSPVIMWDAKTQQAVYNFFGLLSGVLHVKFSPDERMLAACGRDNSVYIWDLSTGEQIFTKRVGTDEADAVSFLAWGPLFSSNVSKRPAYTLCFSVYDKVHMATVEYDFRVMRYSATIISATSPSTGFARRYSCAQVSPDGSALLCGTTTGEITVYQVKPHFVYKAALVAAGNGVKSICIPPSLLPDGRMCAYVGGGDSLLRCFVGREAAWVCTAEARCHGPVVGISMPVSAGWLLAGTASGKIHRVSFGCDLRQGVSAPSHGQPGRQAAVDTIESSHTAAILGLCFHPRASDAMATVSLDQTVRLWDLNSYYTSWVAPTSPAGPAPTALWMAAPSGGADGQGKAPGTPCDIYAGYNDGTLRAYSVGYGSGGEMWRVDAHRGGVSCVTGNRAVVVTGGADGRVNVWSRQGHDLLLTFHEHTKPIVSLSLDCSNPEIVYSAGADKVLQTMNLRAERRVKTHSLPPADTLATSLTCIAQATHPTSEQELYIGSTDGRIFAFDPAIPDVHTGVTDVLALLLDRERAGQGQGIVPKAKPGQVRPDLKIVALRFSPSGKHLACATSCGRVLVLTPALGRPAAPVQPRAQPTFVDHSGIVRQVVKSSGSSMRLRAVLVLRSPWSDLQWSPDERQLVLVGTDGCWALLNWYGSE